MADHGRAGLGCEGLLALLGVVKGVSLALLLREALPRDHVVLAPLALLRASVCGGAGGAGGHSRGHACSGGGGVGVDGDLGLRRATAQVVVVVGRGQAQGGALSKIVVAREEVVEDVEIAFLLSLGRQHNEAVGWGGGRMT